MAGTQQAIDQNYRPISGSAVLYDPVSTQFVAQQSGTTATGTDGTVYAPKVMAGIATATGGSTPYHLVSAASANNTNVKSSAGSIYGYSISNTTASTTEFVKLYNKATAPVAGTDTPIWSIQVAGSTTVTAYFSVPIGCSAGVGLATVTTAADAGSTGVASGDLIINLIYK